MSLPFGIRVPSIGLRVKVDMFFDRAAVKDAMSDGEYKALTKSSMKVKDIAKKSIKKKGMARLPFKVQENFPGAGINTLLASGAITARMHKTIVREIRTPPASAPGSPPFTHTPYSGGQASYLGFRRNLWNYYDSQTHSAVVGPSKKGRSLPYLHEFGGDLSLRTWVWVPKYGAMRRPITMKLPMGQRPRDTSKWTPTSIIDSKVYPARPFMGPALQKAVTSGAIAKAFKNCMGNFRATSGSAGTFIGRK